MGQVKLQFSQPFTQANQTIGSINDGSITFWGFNFYESISLNTVNMMFSHSITVGTASISVSLGLYSLNGGNLSIANSISRTYSYSTRSESFVSLTGTSATQNITPGTWYWGLLVRTNNSNMSYLNLNSIAPGNAFPGGFIGGRMTVSTAALPDFYATSDLDITGTDAMASPNIIISA